MSSLSEKIEIICPKCGEDFGAWSHTSVDPATSSSCPNCGFNLAGDPLLREEAPWQPTVEDTELLDR
jgi:hypothetical protein